MFSVKDVVNGIGMRAQAIYKDTNNLTKKGYMYKNENGDWRITPEGFNYLKDRYAKQLQKKNNLESNSTQPTNEVVNQPQPTQAQELPQIKDFDTLNLLYNQVKQQLATTEKLLEKEQEEKAYFKLKFEEKDNLLNQYINTHLLPPGNKPGFFSKIFNKKEENK